MKKFKILFLLISLLVCFGGTINADTINIQLPHGTQNFCQDTNNFDTFVFYKPIGFGSTIWKINGFIQGSGDSLVFVPTSIGYYNVTATWNSNVEGAPISLFSTPPAHAQFEVLSGGQVLSGGHMNANDTVWMCGSSVSLGSSPSIYGDTYAIWHGLDGFSSTNMPVSITTPGVYYFERGNPCGVTRDTFVVVKLATTVPNWVDTVFCNQPVSLTLDPGPGWFTYTWSTGAHTQSIYVDTAGTYTVSLSNVCTSGSATMVVEHQSYPMPDLMYQEIYESLCADTVIVLDPAPGYTYDSYTWQWSTGTATTPTLSVSGLTTGDGWYYVTVTKGSCSAQANVEYHFYDVPIKPEICIVTVDISLNKNQVVWTSYNEPLPGDPDHGPIASYNIYKATSGWQLIGNVPANQEHTFTDMTSSPATVSSLYKITAVDQCGVESQKSYYHKTILLAVNQGANPGEIPLIWNDYLDESGTFVVDQYYIYRGDSPSTLTLLDSVSGYITSYIDTGVYTQKFYQIVVNKAGGCDPSPQNMKSGEKSIITTISSNVTKNTLNGVVDNNFSTISLYPNPSNGIFHIEGMPVSHVEIMDALGRVVTTYSSSVIDLSAFGGGVYYARIFTPQGSTIKKLIKQ